MFRPPLTISRQTDLYTSSSLPLETQSVSDEFLQRADEAAGGGFGVRQKFRFKPETLREPGNVRDAICKLCVMEVVQPDVTPQIYTHHKREAARWRPAETNSTCEKWCPVQVSRTDAETTGHSFTSISPQPTGLQNNMHHY